MKKIRIIITSLTLIILGLVNLLGFWEVISPDYSKMTYQVLFFIGIVFVYTSLGNNSRGILFLGSVLFIAGVLIFSVENYEILNPVKLILPTLLFAIGTGFIMLFIDNTKEINFLYIGFIFLSISLILVYITDTLKIISFANRIAFSVLEFWPVFIVLFGIGLLLNRKNL